MSYNHAPEWTEKIKLPPIKTLTCPACDQLPSNAIEVYKVLEECGYYEPRHIPPCLIATCSNAECPRCDDDIKVHLKATIEVVRVEIADPHRE